MTTNTVGVLWTHDSEYPLVELFDRHAKVSAHTYDSVMREHNVVAFNATGLVWAEPEDALRFAHHIERLAWAAIDANNAAKLQKEH